MLWKTRYHFDVCAIMIWWYRSIAKCHVICWSKTGLHDLRFDWKPWSKGIQSSVFILFILFYCGGITLVFFPLSCSSISWSTQDYRNMSNVLASCILLSILDYIRATLVLPRNLPLNCTVSLVCILASTTQKCHLNTLRPRQNGRDLADNIFKCIFLNENVRISLKISLKFVTKVQINKFQHWFR